MTFEQNWANLQARKQAQDAGTLNKKFKDQHPLTPSFVKWANLNFPHVRQILDTPTGTEHEPMSIKDSANYSLRVREREHRTVVTEHRWELKKDAHSGRSTLEKVKIPRKEGTILIENETPAEIGRLRKLFPVSQKYQDHIAHLCTDWAAEIRKIEAKIAEWNPRVQTIEEADSSMQPEYDEFGNPMHDEYTVEPEIIGDPVRDGLLQGTREVAENPHLIGYDENQDEVYTDFSEDGLYLPQENPYNSSDTRDDADMTDHTEYRAQDWQSEDLMDDHNVVPYFSEQTVSEIPNIVETQIEREDGQIAVYEHIEWETETHANAEAPVHAVDDEDWVEDARNWLPREGMLQEAEDELVIGEIMLAYPVSDKFLDYLDENEIDWAVASSRLTELVENRSNIEWV